ncbi:MAG: DUF421 domain-containing protein [Acidobacteriota bacterium]|nr:DUF421 domain-containing protein [Acidobacteriota bacterium]
MVISWQELFIPSVSVVELIVRGSLVYLALFALLRFVLKRVTGTFSIGDLLMIVLIADAAQNAMSAGYTSVTDGIILVSTIIFWSYALDWLGYRFPRFQKILHPPPLPLVREGRMLARNMRRELITVDELMSHLREQGVDDLRQVESACMEGDGRISVVRYDENETRLPEQRIG